MPRIRRTGQRAGFLFACEVARVAKPLTPEEREAIIAEFATGKSCRQIARKFGRSPSTISKLADEVGHEFGRSNVERAVAIKRRYGAEWRAEMREKLAAEAERLLADIRKPMLVYNFGGRDNTYNEHVIPEPDARAKRDLMQAVAVALRTILEFDKTDATIHDLGILDQWFAEIDRNADEYEARAADGEAGA